MESMYPRELEALRLEGKRIAEVGCFADRRREGIRFTSVFFSLTKLLVQTARTRGYDSLVVAVHPRHAKFYRRALGFEDIGELTYCPYVSYRPAVALLLDLSQSHGTEHFEGYSRDLFPDDTIRKSNYDDVTQRFLRDMLDVSLLPIMQSR